MTGSSEGLFLFRGPPSLVPAISLPMRRTMGILTIQIFALHGPSSCPVDEDLISPGGYQDLENQLSGRCQLDDGAGCGDAMDLKREILSVEPVGPCGAVGGDVMRP